ncbi:MAG: transposase [Paracoccaceae bacterium]|nr:transposase [Paracoccaceae bacterium]
MSSYRRALVNGATYFFTVALADRSTTALVENIGLLRDAVARTGAELPFRIDAMVILPDHLHAVWTLPEGDAAFPERWRRIKARFSHGVGGAYRRTASKIAKREVGLWQRRYWEHVIRDERDYRAHVEYCWGNPVKHGVVARAVEWPYSSIHRDIRRGLVAPEWVGGDVDGNFGE